MSYSQDVKTELMDCLDNAKHCMLAELAAIYSHLGTLYKVNDEQRLEIRSDNELLIRKCFTLAGKSFNISSGACPENRQSFILTSPREIDAFLKGLKIHQDSSVVDSRLIRHNCCKRAFLRGMFLAAGSMSDPESSYHLEFVCSDKLKSEQLISILSDESIEARMVFRKGRFVVYLKEGAGIVELLGIMGAHISLMKLENLRIIKEMRGSINRRVNCETANIAKTVTASSKQIEDIILIRDHRGLSSLPGGLKDIAAVRLEYPDVSLKELGERLDPPIGKSGVNHRLRKISEIAEGIREEMPEDNP